MEKFFVLQVTESAAANTQIFPLLEVLCLGDTLINLQVVCPSESKALLPTSTVVSRYALLHLFFFLNISSPPFIAKDLRSVALSLICVYTTVVL